VSEGLENMMGYVQISNVDLPDYFDNYIYLKEGFEILLKMSVHLVENQAIKNPIFRKVVDRDKVLLYERKNT